ncbi:hypothetical protein EOD41_08920 [Mucilaginibacter limnophilus]|uniref:DUF4760 domain-containing protein n=1 Tax=Mucilaginibacter limnophilus TaxID=1932778 RepID=A0A437MWL4_9SPHI|nr:hypothetical protein [Mucilaginibacter limnophilus]RVU02061.1 hypothetical protein EOD41_08920 [Mucilaginibacter limnophilus]
MFVYSRMSDNNTILQISAFAGLAGALLTQVLTGTFTYLNDRRKQKNDVRNQYRSRMVEVGESFYFMNGELMSMIKKNIAYWTNRRDDRSLTTLQYLKNEMEELDAYQNKLNTENWKYNLASIYFDLPFTMQEMLETNRTSHQLYLKVLDLSDHIRNSPSEETETLFKTYHLAVFDLCTHYDKLYHRMEQNMHAVKSQLLTGFFKA